ncbi:MAG: A24 family peptidase [Candidatus Woesearchaeota archaeon]
MFDAQSFMQLYGMQFILLGSFEFIALGLAFLVLIIASIHDIKKREVPDMLNYGFFFVAIALRLLHYGVTFDYVILIEGLAGFALGFALGMFMFYTGQWGGGDSKMLIGLGTLFGLPVLSGGISILHGVFIAFILNMFLAGSLFGLVWSVVIAFRNYKSFKLAWKRQMELSKGIRWVTYILALMVLGLGFIFIETLFLFLLLGLLIASINYLYVFAKAIERSSMVFMLPPSEVTEGDWIDKEVYHKGKYVCGPKDLGITKKQITLLKRYNIRSVPVKIGIPFIPSFLLGLIVTFFFGNVVVRIVLESMI